MENYARFGSYRNAASSYRKLEPSGESPASINGGDFSFSGSTDRRFAYSRQPSFSQPEPHTPISINDSTNVYYSSYDKIENFADASKGGFLDENLSFVSFFLFIFKSARSGNKQIRKLFVLISLNVAYSSAELCIGLLSGRVGTIFVFYIGKLGF